MGEAKRRKELGLMPEPSQKPRKKVRKKFIPGIETVLLLASLGMLRKRKVE